MCTQIGCFVPALYASFRPISALLTRLSNDDDLAASLSTFASEMSTMSTILGALGAHQGEGENAEPAHCLVLIDELGRGTSPEEGVGIAHAIAEEIIKSKVCPRPRTAFGASCPASSADSLDLLQAFCFFATHFKVRSLALSRLRYSG